LGPVENVPPQAAFTAAASGLDVSFDGSGSSDSDGSIVSYEWDFGDGTFDTGVTPPTKTYAASGIYDVTLTVTDDDGATNAVTQQVAVSEPGSGTMFAQDSFGRSVAGSWGSAEIGGAWSVAYGAPQYDVNGSQGVITSTPGQSGRIALPVDVVDGNGVVDISWDAAPTGGGAYSSLQLRDQGANTFYLARVRVVPTGTYLTLQRWENGSAATLANMSVPGLVYSPGDVYRLRFEIEGTSPTSVRAKLWDAAGSEPAGWQVTATDATAVLQQAGGLGLATYLSASASATTATAFDNLTLQSLVGG
jgi:PKD repeat protein